jgi:tetratricopeptide (TPR) repeat protein
MRAFVFGFLACAILVAAAQPASAQDLVKQKDGKWLVTTPENDPPGRDDHDKSLIQVQNENYDKLVYVMKVGNRRTRQEFDMDRIGRVYHWPMPPAYAEAASAMESGNLNAAIKKFEALTKNSSNRNWVRTYSFSNLLTIHKALNQWQEVINTAERLQRTFSKSRFVPDAVIDSGLAYLNLGDASRAKTAFQKLLRLPGLPEGKKGLARYYVIFITQRQGELAGNTQLLEQALAEYRKLLRDTENEPELAEVATRARLGIGACLVLLGRYDEALSFFKKIAEGTDDAAVLAGAFNGLGQCYFKQNEWDKALRAFLRTEVLYGTESPEQDAMALFYSGECFRFLAPSMKDDMKDKYKARAKGQYRKCMRKYNGTSWANQSREAIIKVR